jgi:hypothetical protein
LFESYEEKGMGGLWREEGEGKHGNPSLFFGRVYLKEVG